EKGISAYDEMTGNGLVRHIVTRVGFHTGEVMAVLVINGKTLPEADELVRRLVDGVGALPETVTKPEDTSETTAGSILKREDTGDGTEAAAGSISEPEGTGDVAQAAKNIAKSEDISEAAESIIKSEGSAGAAAGSNPKPEDTSETAVDAGHQAIKSIYLNVNTENTNIIMGPKNILLYGSETITDTIGNYRFLISPQSFFQVNPVQTEVLYSKAMEYAALSGDETVFDLYCGIGTISLFLSEKARYVYGVEVVEDAVADARRNAELNGVSNVEFIAGEAEKVVPELYGRGIRADVVVLDPPRKGCDESLLKLLSEMQPKRIVYVSCNPATLARDLKYLVGNGFKAVEAQPVDMFPWTGHVECVIMMTNSGSKGE
ncbi:MAG: 23S rRNA (uracil(1939)-C(5))-methyltransferase RlmD, partial [Smithella sp.]